MRKKLLKLIVISAMVVVIGMTSLVAAGAGEVEYPNKNKTMTIMVERGAGGGSDLIARSIAPLLSNELGIPVIVVNKVGGDGVVGLNELAKSKPDGYTIDLSADTVQAIHSVMYEHAEYDENSWDYLAATNYTSYIMVLGKGSSFSNLKEMMEYAKRNPKKLTIGTPSSVAEVMSTLEMKTGTQFTQIVNNSGANNLASIAGGHVDVGILTAQFYQQAVDQGLKVIGVMSDERFPSCSDVPTFVETGYDVVVIQNWIVIMPKGASQDVLTTIKTAMDKVGNSAKFIDSLKAINTVPRYIGSEEVQEYILDNIKNIKNGLEAWNK